VVAPASRNIWISFFIVVRARSIVYDDHAFVLGTPLTGLNFTFASDRGYLLPDR
jgi:hypothetical protein